MGMKKNNNQKNDNNNLFQLAEEIKISHNVFQKLGSFENPILSHLFHSDATLQ